MKGRPLLSRCIRTGSALLFLWAGIDMALHPATVFLTLATLGLSLKLAEWLTIIVAALEATAGIMLLNHIRFPEATIFTNGLLLIFCAFLYFLRTLANPPSCGCPGLHGIFDSAHAEALLGLLRNVTLMLLLAWAYKNETLPVNGAPSTELNEP